MPAAYIQLGRQIARRITAWPAARHTLQFMSQRGLLPTAVWMRLPVVGEFTVSLPSGETFRYTAIAEEGIGRGLHWRGISGYESETARIFYALAKESKVIVDIGANTGTYTLIACAANKEARIYAFEPIPYLFERLTSNVVLNQWQGRCVLQNIAVSDINGILPIHVPNTSAAPVAASLKSDGFRAGDGYLLDVQVNTIDNVCGNEPVDLIKMDVEGVEDKVLLGMRNTLGTSAPIIITECFPDGPIRQIEAILLDYDYSFFHIRRNELVSKSHIEPDEHYQNYLCVPRQRLDVIAKL